MVRGRARGGAKRDLAPCPHRRQTIPVYLLYALLLCVVSFLCATAAVVLLLRYVHIVSCETVLVCIMMLLLLLQKSFLLWAGCYCAFSRSGMGGRGGRAYSLVAHLSHLTIDHASLSRRSGGGFLSRWSCTAGIYMVCGTASLVLLFAIKLNLTGNVVQICNATRQYLHLPDARSMT